MENKKNEVYFDYDEDNDSLFISKKTEEEIVKGSIVLDNLSLDFTTEGKIVGIEIIGISDYLNDWDFDTELLNNIKKANLIIRIRRGGIIDYGIILNGTKIPFGKLTINNPEISCSQ